MVTNHVILAALQGTVAYEKLTEDELREVANQVAVYMGDLGREEAVREADDFVANFKRNRTAMFQAGGGGAGSGAAGVSFATNGSISYGGGPGDSDACFVNQGVVVKGD